MIFFIFAKNLAMRKEIGKWLMDVGKYVATAVLISSFIGEFKEKWIVYIIGSFTVILTLTLGLIFIKDKPTTKTSK